jgi:endoglucanase
MKKFFALIFALVFAGCSGGAVETVTPADTASPALTDAPVATEAPLVSHGVNIAEPLIQGSAINLNRYEFAKDEVTPFMVNIYTVSPDILAFYVEDGWLEWGRHIPYVKQDGDVIRAENDGEYDFYMLNRNGEDIAYYMTDHNGGEFITLNERQFVQRLDYNALRRAQNFVLFSQDDENYHEHKSPRSIYLKSKPVDFLLYMPPDGAVMGHWAYLVLDEPLKENCTYQIDFSATGIAPLTGEFFYDSKSYVSEAIHVGQGGFSVNDPQKRAFLSLWMSYGRHMEYPEGMTFDLIDENGDSHYTGDVVLTFPRTQREELTASINKNFNLTDVFTMDFSDFNRNGEYRVHIAGIGTSYPFRIDGDVWQNAFHTAMKGFYHQRSGIVKEEPYTTEYIRPRDFHPDEGVVVYASATSLMEAGGGLNAFGTDRDNFGNIVAGKTDEIVENAWGGYFDAGDWDRRVQHIEASRLQMELLMLAPEFFGGLHLNIPESGNGFPDILNEVLWNVDFYRRMQIPDGGIRGGIEYERYPRYGEMSWLNNCTSMAYAPDHWSSYIYASGAARVAYTMETLGIGEPEVYKQSALAAFEWAEKERVKWLEPDTQARLANATAFNGSIDSERRKAALELYRLTGEQHYHDIFKDDFPIRNVTSPLYVWNRYDVREPLGTYLYLPEEMRDAYMSRLAYNALIYEADFIVEYSTKNAFGLAHTDVHANLAWGSYSIPNIQSLVRAHYLTGEEKYLRTLLGQMNFSTGANSANASFFNGVGNFPKTALVVDTRHMGILPYSGITIMGPYEYSLDPNHWAYFYHINDLMDPAPGYWPNVDGFVPLFNFAKQSEHQIHGAMSVMSYLLGYLAYASQQ